MQHEFILGTSHALVDNLNKKCLNNLHICKTKYDLLLYTNIFTSMLTQPKSVYANIKEV